MAALIRCSSAFSLISFVCRNAFYPETIINTQFLIIHKQTKHGLFGIILFIFLKSLDRHYKVSIEVKSAFSVESVPVSGRVLDVDQGRIAMLVKATMAMGRSRGPIRHTMALPGIESLKLTLGNLDRFRILFVSGSARSSEGRRHQRAREQNPHLNEKIRLIHLRYIRFDPTRWVLHSPISTTSFRRLVILDESTFAKVLACAFTKVAVAFAHQIYMFMHCGRTRLFHNEFM